MSDTFFKGIELLAAIPVFYYPLTFLVSVLVGSFLNVVIYRTPKILEKEFKQECCDLLEIDNRDSTAAFSLAFPPSTCPSCSKAIKPWHNIPILSYLLLRGQCHDCDAPIGVRYPLVELATGLLSLLMIALLGFTAQGLVSLILLWFLIALTMIDMDTFLLPDQLTLTLLWLGLIANSFGLYTDLHSALWGAIVGYTSLWSVFWLFKLITGKEGMGYGDFKLLAALGAWMGWQILPVIIILSSLVGALVGIGGILLLGRDKNKPIPFGPYLAIAGWIAFLWGQQIIASYLHLITQ